MPAVGACSYAADMSGHLFCCATATWTCSGSAYTVYTNQPLAGMLRQRTAAFQGAPAPSTQPAHARLNSSTPAPPACRCLAQQRAQQQQQQRPAAEPAASAALALSSLLMAAPALAEEAATEAAAEAAEAAQGAGVTALGWALIVSPIVSGLRGVAWAGCSGSVVGWAALQGTPHRRTAPVPAFRGGPCQPFI